MNIDRKNVGGGGPARAASARSVIGRTLVVPVRAGRGTSRALTRCALLATLALGSCASDHRSRDWSDYTGPGAEHFQKEELEFPHVDDPLEPVNRVTSAFDYGLKMYVIAPFAALYRYFVPEPVREHLTLAGQHWRFPVRLLNTLLQGKWDDAGEETSRFFVNTTVGVLGLYDPAKDMGLDPKLEDFGQTMGKWGWKRSTYLFLPLLGPSTIRDGLGQIPDAYADPVNLDWRVSAFRSFNEASDLIEPARRLVEANYDAYEPARTLYVLSREVDTTDFTWKSDDSAPTQTLEAIFLKAEDPAFADLARTKRVELAPEKELPFTVWMQPKPAPVFYFVPGLGGHRLSDSSLGMAEMMYASGSSVVAVSNPTNWEFIENGSSVRQPGFAPVDAVDLHVALTAIDRKLDAESPGMLGTRRLAGVSMGAFQTLFIASREEQAKAEGLMTFDVYMALDTPVNLEHAMTQLDRFYNAPMAFEEKERAKKIEGIFAKVLYLSQGDLQPGMELPFTEIESRFLIGLAFRMELQYTLLQTQELHDRGVLLTKRSRMRRAPAFREASEYSFLEYVYAFLLPDLAERDSRFTFDEAGARAMFAACDLRSIVDALATNERVRIFANENDFLLRAEDVAWLREHFGERATILPAGGHLGNLHRKSIQEAIKAVVEAAAP